jgi:alanine racemase
VKADAYGVGAREVTRALARAGCDTFFVARPAEGVALRPLVPDARIFVLDGVPSATATVLRAHRLIPVLNSLDQMALWQAAAPGADAALHVDTGMSRLGLPPDELAVLVREHRTRLSGLNLCLILSHLARADESDAAMNRLQLARFREALARLPPAPASLSASAGILLGRDYHFDLVRPGLALYGGNPLAGQENPFATVVRLEGRILQRRCVDKGESVGYGASFRVEGPMVLATVALGYADGLMRTLGNRGTAAIAGRRVPFVGRVSMDAVTLDVTAVPDALRQPGAMVEFLGDTISLEELAAASGPANYEILTALSRRAARHYEDAP